MPAFRELFLLWKSKRFFEKALEEAVIQGKIHAVRYSGNQTVFLKTEKSR